MTESRCSQLITYKFRIHLRCYQYVGTNTDTIWVLLTPPKHSLELFPPVTSCFLLVLLPTSELVLSVEGNGTLKSLRVWSVTCGSVSHQPSGHGWQPRGLYMGWAMCAMASQARSDHGGCSVLGLSRGMTALSLAMTLFHRSGGATSAFHRRNGSFCSL